MPDGREEPDPDEPFGVIDGVAKDFGAGKALVPALERVDYRIRRGDLVSLLGPSGCGKTTLLRIVAGLVPATSGRVVIGGRPVHGPQQDFGFVFQAPTLLPWRSVLGNVLLPIEMRGRISPAARERALDLLRTVGLQDFASARPHTLSGGMRQRAALCRALVGEPSMILMDEPFGALDELTRMAMHDLLLDVRRLTGTTIVFVTHSISEAVYLSDDILVLSGRPGRVVDRIAVDLPYPRRSVMRYSPEASRLERRAGAALGVVERSA